MSKSENLERLHVVERKIVATYIFSSDDMLLMGQKSPEKPGVYPGVWHIPGGKVETTDASLVDAAVREANEEVIGLDLVPDNLTELPNLDMHRSSPGVSDSGENVCYEMDFYHFATYLGHSSLELIGVFTPGDDLANLEWFSRHARGRIPLIPGGRELMLKANFID